MKTSNWILALFFASFMIVSTIAFTVANYYSGDNFYSEENLRTAELSLEPFSVVVAQGKGMLNFKESDLQVLQFISYDEVGDWQPEILVRNDTCFIRDFKVKQYFEKLIIQGNGLKSVIISEDINFFLDEFSGDSLKVEANGGWFHFNPELPNQQFVQLEGRNGANFGLQSVHHVQIQLEDSKAYINGRTNILEGEIGKDSHIIIDKSPQQILISKTENGSVTMHR